jgi:hypothetical protein
MPVSDEDLDESVERAAEEIRHAKEAGEHSVVAVTARAHGVDRQRLSRRLKGVGSRSSRKPVSYKLSPIQEAALIQYIRTLDGIGVGIHLDQLRSRANAIVRNAESRDLTLELVYKICPNRIYCWAAICLCTTRRPPLYYRVHSATRMREACSYTA